MKRIVFSFNNIKIELGFNDDQLKEMRVIYVPRGKTIVDGMIIACVDITNAPFLEQCYDAAFAVAKQLLEAYDFEMHVSED